MSTSFLVYLQPLIFVSERERKSREKDVLRS